MNGKPTTCVVEIVVGKEVWNKSRQGLIVKLASLNDRINASIVSSMARMRYGGLTTCYHLENGNHFDDLSPIENGNHLL